MTLVVDWDIKPQNKQTKTFQKPKEAPDFFKE